MTTSTATAPTRSVSLNEGQQAAADAFFSFLLDPEAKEFIISGAGGVGKTFLLSEMIDDILPKYHDTCALMGFDEKLSEVVMTATTNKAAEVLAQATQRPTETIHSFLRLKVKNDFETGKQKLSKRQDWMVHENKVIFIDECSMIDSDLYFMIQAGTHNCKIVYVGDHSQLAPVMERVSPVYLQKDVSFAELTEVMRNSGQPALMDLCQQFRETVATREFKPIRAVPGVIDHLDDEEMEYMVNKTFAQDNPDARILAYTNQRVVDYNAHIRDIRGLPDDFQVGEDLINSQACQVQRTMISVEQEVRILRLSPDIEVKQFPHDAELQFRRANLELSNGAYVTDVPIPVDPHHHRELTKFFGRMKDWTYYFHLKQMYPDLRPKDATTVYKSQGSTYDTVFIDLGNIGTCTNPDQAARMLYVAVSRPKNRIFLYGNLPDRFGGPVI